HKFHRYHTLSNHFYISRPIFVHRPSFEGWPENLRKTMRSAAAEAIVFQRDLHVREEEDARRQIEAAGGEIVELAPEEHRAFAATVTPIYAETQRQYDKDLLALL